MTVRGRGVLLALLALVLLPAAGWPTYQHDPQRTGASADTLLSPGNAETLTRLWIFRTGGPVAASPAVSGGRVYIGSWDGNEYALDPATGTLRWKTYLGVSKGGTSGFCRSFGITSTASVVRRVVYVGGGKPFWYALNGVTGKVLWRVRTGDERDNGRYYNWASPLIDRGYGYIGIASKCDVPLVQGALLRVNLATHRIVGRFHVVPHGQLGGAIWTSPALDAASGLIYVTTGNEGHEPAPSQPYARAIIALRKSLSVKDVWQLPDSEVSNPDSDWGGTPTLFRDAGGRNLIAAVNKNGFVYAFLRGHLRAGPVWRRQIARPDLNISSAAFGGGSLFVAGSAGQEGGVAYKGSVRALDPATGTVRWLVATPGAVWPALSYVNGLLIDGAGKTLQVRNASTGHVLFSYKTGGALYGPAAVANGRIFVGSTDGNVYAFGPPPPP